MWSFGLYGCVVTALLVAELRSDKRAQYFFKPLAALGFILLALMCGALDSIYGQVMLVGLIACALGDVLLLARESKRLFTFGIAAFALGHIFYGVAFRLDHYPLINFGGREIVGLAMCLSIAGSFLWLRPHLEKTMLIPVILYCLIIGFMVVMSSRMMTQSAYILVPLAAIMFAVSDMFVARDRFIKPDPLNALAITPLYFSAQALFALSVKM